MKIVQRMCRIEYLKLATGDGFDGLETPDSLAVEKLSGVSAPKRSDHTVILTLNVINVKRYYQEAAERGTPRVNGAWICSELSIHLSTRLPEFYRFPLSLTEHPESQVFLKGIEVAVVVKQYMSFGDAERGNRRVA